MTDTTLKTVDETILKFLPGISALIGFVPGAQIAQPILSGLTLLLKALDEGSVSVAAATGQPATEAMAEVTSHLTPGEPNSPTLSAPPDASES
jgi:hypothetical protein